MDKDIWRPKRPSHVSLRPHTSALNDVKPSDSDSGPRFQPPETVAEQDDKQEALASTHSDMPDIPTLQSEHPKQKKSLKAWFASRTKKQWIIIACVALVILGGVGYGTYYLWFRHTPKPVAYTVKKAAPNIPAPAPTTVPSPLTGLPVSPSAVNNPVTGVMIENSDQARPQSGLSQAGVVFEALAEGGITRFLALYQNEPASSVGPIRSARPYFIDWLLPFDAGYAHVGGSPDALNEIPSLGVRDMNQSYNGSYYTRITSREAPHNVYTSIAELNSLEQSKGWTTSNFTGFARKADSPSKTPDATDIDFNISNSDMEVNYAYNAQNNSYERSEGGSTMVDAATGQQLDPKVVIAMVVPWTNGPLDALNAYYVDYSDIGSGTAYVFQDGTVTEGKWDKPTQSSQVTFQTDSGATIKLNAGQTWITVLGGSNLVSYKS